MQGKSFLFGRSDPNPRPPTLLFTKWEFSQVLQSNSNSSLNSLPQSNLPRVQPWNENAGDSFYTPPMERKPANTPRAPIKHKKQPKKGDLKPKKLQYTEDELDISYAVDSGIHTETDQSSSTVVLSCKQQRHKTITCNSGTDSSQKQLRHLRAKLNRIKVQPNDKENDKKCHVATNLSGEKNSSTRQTSSVVVFNPNAEVLSQCDPSLSWVEKLKWLQPRRDIGLWIECCREACRKWRYTENYHDPVEVPNNWYCEMNSDKSLASCSIPEHPLTSAIKTDLIENVYNAGSIVWAFIPGFPWWPGIINDCPDTFCYYQLPRNSLEPIRYYVTFFNEGKLECAWVHKRRLKSFAQCKYDQVIKRTIYHGVDYAEPLKRACETATSVLSLPILERLRRFSFVAQYEKFIDVNNNFDPSINNNNTVADSSSEMDINFDDEIPCSNPVQKHLTLEQYYLNVLCKERDTI